VYATANEGFTYKNTLFHHIEKGLLIQGGDFLNGTGAGRVSIYGVEFPDENFYIKQFGAGTVCYYCEL
jgi:cyclophilin family peptidyl-prolyl cis-trans isomerase